MSKINIVLVETSHPGNIGAVARAMKSMGLSKLTLFKPKLFPHAEATARAAGADDILSNAVITGSLEEAIKEATIIFGTSTRERSCPIEVLSPEASAKKIFQDYSKNNIAIIFGRENNGLSNEELSLCNYHIRIPTNTSFSSLNLAAAVQIIAYEIKKISQHSNTIVNTKEILATGNEMNLFYKHLESTLKNINFLREKPTKKIIYRLHRLFNRAKIEKTEVNILRGILTAIDNSRSK